MQPHWQRQINQRLGADYNWEIFARGSGNLLYRGRVGNQQVVLRRNGPVSKTPGVDRAREALLLDLISSYQWSPNIIKNQHREDWCVMQYYQPLTNKYSLENKDPQTSLLNSDDASNITRNDNTENDQALESVKELSDNQQHQLMAAITDLQNHPLDTKLTNKDKSLLTIDYQQLWDTVYLPQAQACNDQITIVWLKQIKHQLDSLPPIPSTLVHHDLHIGNLALDTSVTADRSAQLILLDWEYGGIGNAWLDAAALVRFLNVPSEIIFNLPCFKQLTKPCFRTGLKQAIELSELINKLWYRARSEIKLDLTLKK